MVGAVGSDHSGALAAAAEERASLDNDIAEVDPHETVMRPQLNVMSGVRGQRSGTEYGQTFGSLTHQSAK